MASTKHLGRREFLRLSAMAAVGAVAASCAKPTPEVIEKPVTVVVEKEVAVEKQVLQTVVVEKQVPVEKVVKETVVVEKAVEVEKVVKETVIVEKEVVSSQLREAPMLAELVAAGKLPPVDERMPLKPKVCNEMPPSQLAFQVGRYGGTIRTLTSSANWDTDIFVMCNEPLINTPGILGEEITGNICDAFQVNAEQTEFTFHMREGIKWSDGTPVTTEDVRFAYEDVMMNTDLTARPPTWLRSGNKGTGTPYVVKVKDDYTFTISFDKPYGGFLLVLGISGWRSYIEVLKPAHYLKKFHTKYASKAEIDAAIKEANVEGWPQLFALKDVTNWEMTYPPALTFPSLYPWILKETSQQGQIYERNPYYFKVDPAGNQLPYVDYLDSAYVADTEVIQMKILAGETDFSRSHPKFVKLPLYKENEEKGGFTTAMVQFHATSIDLFLNLTHVDPVWRQVVRNPDFRRALNLALDREEIIDAVLYGYASLPDFNPAEYNVEKANQLLDSIGLNKKNADGYRLGPDGQVFEIPFETGVQRTDMIPTLELVVQFWEKVGIRTTMKTIDGALWTQRSAANELKATIYWVEALWYNSPVGINLWAPLWDQWWNTGGAEGEEPPQDVKDLLDVRATITTLPPAEGIKAYAEMKKLVADQIYFFVPVEKVLQPLIFSKRLGNVSDSPDAIAIGVNFSAEQFYFKS
ncbi:MAG: ABC transporter substrate-binding protein [Chloroflexi bacterium]|nr:ABC transporter substrate-binding protein [Chloroflexota bacterium]